MDLNAAERRVVESAVARGWLSQAQVEVARADAARTGQALLSLLRDRFLSPSQAQALGRVYEEAVQESGRRAAVAPEAPRVGPYRITGELGRGGMGVVHRAVGPDGVERAVKVLLRADGSRLARFAREAAVLEFVGRHRNVVSFFGAGEERGAPWLAMELLEGGSLVDRLERTPRDLRALVADLAAIAGALHFAHEAGVLHRDVKASNILYDEEGRPHLADFGVAADAQDVERLTRTGELTGTVGHMPPEQLDPKGRSLDGRVDVYALGTLLYEVLTGQPPFAGPPLAVLSQVMSGAEPQAPRALAPDAPRALERACLRAMAKDLAARTPTAAAFQTELLAWLEGADATAYARAPRPAAAPARGGAGVLALTVVACAAGLAVGAGGLVAARRTDAAGARRAEAAALARATLGQDPRREPSTEDEAALLRVVELDPARAEAWAALGALALARGDHARAAECLGRGPTPAEDLRAARLAAALAERDGRDEAARDAALLAVLAGDDEPATVARLARCAARVADARGQPVTAEGLRWHALRADPGDASPLEALLRARLEQGDVEGLTSMWLELRRALAGPTLAELVRAAHAQGASAPADALSAALADLDPPPGVDRPPGPLDPAELGADRALPRRLLAALDAAEVGAPTSQLVGALGELLQATPPLLATAAQSSLCTFGLATIDQTSPRLLGTPWPALTLLESAPFLTRLHPAAIGLAPAPVVRAANALGLAVAATRAQALEPALAANALGALEADPDPLPAGCARRARAALSLLVDEGVDVRSAPLEVVLLARSLLRLPIAPASEERMGTWRGRVRTALAGRREPAACLSRAFDAAALGDLAAAREELASVPTDHVPAGGLRAVLAALRDEPAPALADPLAARRAAALVTLTVATGVPFTQAAAGAVRVDVTFPPGAPPPDRLLERFALSADSPGGRGLDAPATPWRLRLRVPLARADALLARAEATGDADWYLSLPRVGTLVAGRGRGELRSADDQVTPPIGPAATTSVGLSRRRGWSWGSLGRRREGVASAAAASTPELQPFVGSGWASTGRHVLRELTLIGVWSGALEPPLRPWLAPPPLDPVVAAGIRFGRASTADMLRDGVTFAPGPAERQAIAGLGHFVGDLEVRARLVLALGGKPGQRSVGVGLQDLRRHVLASVGLATGGEGAETLMAWASLQPRNLVDWPRAGARVAPARPVHVRLRRNGDVLTFAAGVDPEALEPLGAPVVFPVGEPAFLLLHARNLEPGERVRFDLLEVRGRTHVLPE